MTLPRALLSALLTAATLAAAAQPDVLVAADFDACALPAGWTVDIDGNPDAVWYVGTPTSPSSDGTTIDGTCMVIVDDDATGDNTPAFTWHLVTPSFDVDAYSTVELSADAHFRNAGEGASLSVQVSTPTGWQTLQRWSGSDFTGQQFSDFGTVRLDLSLVAAGATQVRFSYDDNGGFAWWAGVDNVRITGTRGGRLLLAETFDACSLPADWSTDATRGDDLWQFGTATNPNLGAGEQSINGSCMAFFDDDVVGEDAPPSTALLYGPWLDLRDVSALELSYDFVFRRAIIDEQLGVYLDDGRRWHLVEAYATDQGGPGFDVFRRATFDVSALRSARARLVFEYGDGGGWGWYAGVDNVKLVGRDAINDQCARAETLTLGAAPVAFDNRLALDGTTPCSTAPDGSLWYSYTAAASGTVDVELATDFNDQLTVYRGACASPEQLRCRQRDEHGFGGETLSLSVTAGETYLLQVAGTRSPFGRSQGTGTVALRQNPTLPAPPHSTCAEALPLGVGEWSPRLSNYGARQPGVDTAARLLRHTQYVRTTVASGGDYRVELEADFAAELEVFAGTDCVSQQMLGRTDRHALLLEGLAAGETVTIRVAGAFATVEADWRLRLVPAIVTAPAACSEATVLTSGTFVDVPTLASAAPSAATASCARAGDRSTWYRFTTDASGAFTLDGELDYAATVSVHADDCAAPTELACARLRDACEGALTFELAPATSYLLQLSASSPSGGGRLRAAHGASGYEPLHLAAMVVCQPAGLGELQLVATGGRAPFEVTGPQDGQLVMHDTAPLVVVRDADGCEVSERVSVDCAPDDCGLAVRATFSDEACAGNADGAIALDLDDPTASISWADDANAGSTRADLAPGTYTATLSLPDGCTAEQAFVIAPARPLTAEATATAATATGGGALDLRPRGGSGRYAYAWTDASGAPVSEREDPSDLPAGDYRVRLTDSEGCSADFGPYTVPGASSTRRPTEAEAITPFPNPTRGEVTLRLPESLRDQELRLTLVDVLGRTTPLPALQASAAPRIDLSAYPAGAYTLRVVVGEQLVELPVVRVR